tara:strand:- start:4987 stop:5409 length:423 start_codon:yes stop_codon:yes gene_type:complete
MGEENGDELDVQEYILFHLKRSQTNLFKRYLGITEDLLKEHKIMLKKIEDETSKDFSKNIDYFTEDKYNYIRKKILDIGNESLRDLERHMEMLAIKLNEDTIKKIRDGRLKQFNIHELPGKRIWVEGDSNGKQRFKGKVI